MHTVNPGVSGLPRSLDVMQTYDKMQAAFPGGQIPADVVVKADDVTSPEAKTAIAKLEQDAIAIGALNAPAASPRRRSSVTARRPSSP